MAPLHDSSVTSSPVTGNAIAVRAAQRLHFIYAVRRKFVEIGGLAYQRTRKSRRSKASRRAVALGGGKRSPRSTIRRLQRPIRCSTQSSTVARRVNIEELCHVFSLL